VDKLIRKYPNNLLIIVESGEHSHKQIIETTVAKRAYQIFEKRGCKHGFDLEDWVIAEKELLRDDFDGNTSEFHFLFDCPRSGGDYDSELDNPQLGSLSKPDTTFRQDGKSP
jgi:hypothetical protein